MLLDDNYLAHHGIIGQRCGIRRFQNKDGTLTEEGKKRYGDHSDLSDGEEKTDKKTEEQLKNEYDSGKRQALKDFSEADAISDPIEREKRFGKLLKDANKALGPYYDSTYPGYDDDNPDAYGQAYNIKMCLEFDKKIKGICDPLGTRGRGTEGKTPCTKAITDKMKENIDQQNEIWERVREEYKSKHKLKAKNIMNIIQEYNNRSDVRNLKKEYAKIELEELRAEIVKELGLPPTKEYMGYVYPFIYADPFNLVD